MTSLVVFEKIQAIVTDNAASMKKACKILQKKTSRLLCPLAKSDCARVTSIKEYSGYFETYKIIVSFLKSSSIAYAKLKSAQNTSKPLSLIQEVPTRWNSALYMLRRVLLLRETICAVNFQGTIAFK